MAAVSMAKSGVVPYQGCSCMSGRLATKLAAFGHKPPNDGRVAVFMSVCCCPDKESNWRIRFDPIRNMDRSTGVDLIYNFNGVQVGEIDSVPYGRFLPWSDSNLPSHIFVWRRRQLSRRRLGRCPAPSGCGGSRERKSRA